MTIEQFYEKIGGNYPALLNRLGSKDLIKKVAVEFIDDPSYSQLKKAYEAKDIEEAFRAVHTLKGVCSNLGFEELFKVAYDLTEVLRPRSFEGSEEFYQKLCKKYLDLVARLKEVE